MKTIEWETQVEYCSDQRANDPTQTLVKVTQVLQAFHLTEAALRRIQRALTEVVERRPPQEQLMIRLLTTGLTMHSVGRQSEHQTAQGCGFFLIEKNNSAAVAGANTTIELYLFV